MAQTTMDLRAAYASVDAQAEPFEFHGLDDSQIIDFHTNMVIGHGRTMPKENQTDLAGYPSSDSWSY